MSLSETGPTWRMRAAIKATATKQGRAYNPPPIPPRDADIPSESDFGRWVNRAERGESLVYAYQGEGRHPPADNMAVAAKLADAGLVALVRKLVGPGRRFALIAQRTWVKASVE